MHGTSTCYEFGSLKNDAKHDAKHCAPLVSLNLGLDF